MEQQGELLTIRAERIICKPYHFENNLRILYVLKGSIACRWTAGVYTLQEGEIEIININEPVELQKTNQDNLILIFEIDRDRAKFFYDYIDRGLYNCNTTLFYDSTTDERTQRKLKAMLRTLYYYYVEDINHILYENMVREIVVLIGEKCHDLRNMFTQEETNERKERFFRIYTYIYENFNKKINLKELAKGEYISQQYLSKEFNDRLNVNFKDTLEYYRIIQSVRYLIEGKKSITLITELCGFSAPRYFYKHFSRYLNCTPTEFRTRYLMKAEFVQEIQIYDAEVMKAVQRLEEQKKSLYIEAEEPTEFVTPENYNGSFSQQKIPINVATAIGEAEQIALPDRLSVLQITDYDMRKRLSLLFQQEDEKQIIPCIFVIYLNGKDRCSLNQLILKAEEAILYAYRMSLAAKENGLCFNLNNNILEQQQEIRSITGLSEETIPLILIGAGYPVQ